MKKRLFAGLLGVVALAAAVCLTLSTVNTNSSDSDLLIKNIEALTDGENSGGTGSGKTLNCWQTFDNYGSPTHKTYCADCSAHLTARWFDASTCTTK